MIDIKQLFKHHPYIFTSRKWDTTNMRCHRGHVYSDGEYLVASLTDGTRAECRAAQFGHSRGGWRFWRAISAIHLHPRSLAGGSPHHATMAVGRYFADGSVTGWRVSGLKTTL